MPSFLRVHLPSPPSTPFLPCMFMATPILSSRPQAFSCASVPPPWPSTCYCLPVQGPIDIREAGAPSAGGGGLPAGDAPHKSARPCHRCAGCCCCGALAAASVEICSASLLVRPGSDRYSPGACLPLCLALPSCPPAPLLLSLLSLRAIKPLHRPPAADFCGRAFRAGAAGGARQCGCDPCHWRGWYDARSAAGGQAVRTAAAVLVADARWVVHIPRTAC